MHVNFYIMSTCSFIDVTYQTVVNNAFVFLMVPNSLKLISKMQNQMFLIMISVNASKWTIRANNHIIVMNFTVFMEF